MRPLHALLWLLIPSLICAGCVGISATPDPVDDDSATDDDDDDDDSAGDDDSASTDDDDDAVDDNACDEGVEEEDTARFVLRSEMGDPVVGASMRIYDLDAATGDVGTDVLADGEVDEEGMVLATLACADGWMIAEFAHPDHVTAHFIFKAQSLMVWGVALPTLETITGDVGEEIGSEDAGFLAVYKNDPAADIDMQTDDEFRIDGGAQLVPFGVTDGVGMWIYDDAYGVATFGLYYIDHELEGGGTVIDVRYDDASAEYATLLMLPVYSYSDGEGGHHMTVIEIRS
jgi:hypothetical protein